MGRRRWLLAVLVLVLAAVASCTTSTVSTATAPSRSSVPTQISSIVPVHDPGQVTGTLTGPCHMTGIYPDQVPDPRCTPGSYDPAVTQANIGSTICVPKRESSGKVEYVLSAAWAAGRPPETQTNDFKYHEAYPAYGVAESVKTELDHFIAREIGGSNDAKNLWPEPETSIPNAKDRVEDASHTAICNGSMTLSAAQDAMAADWVALGKKLGVKQ